MLSDIYSFIMNENLRIDSSRETATLQSLCTLRHTLAGLEAPFPRASSSRLFVPLHGGFLLKMNMLIPREHGIQRAGSRSRERPSAEQQGSHAAQDDEGREILGLRVIDDDGDSVFLGNRSGGQQVWALKAMRLAMTRISKEKSAKNFQTALSDEEDGGLDVESARKYIMLYRTFMKLADFETCYYITHKRDCVAMADHVLTFNGGIVIE